MPLVSKYEAISAEEPDVADVTGEKRIVHRKKKDGVYEQLSLGEADVDEEEDWNSLRRSDSFEDENFDRTPEHHIHFFDFLGRRYSVSNFTVSKPSFLCLSVLLIVRCIAPALENSIMRTMSYRNFNA
jgi:hypothetical protein